MTTDKTIEVLSTQGRRFAATKEFSEKAHIGDIAEYESLYEESVDFNGDGMEKFWSRMALDFLSWSKPWSDIVRWDFTKPKVEWFVGGKLNAAYNCLDRHMDTPIAEKTAIIWEGDGGEVKKYTYRELTEEVIRFASVLKAKGITKGDRVTLYLPMIPELTIAMLACARIGAIHSVVFGGFSPSSLSGRILDSESSFLVTANVGIRGGKHVPLKENVDKALEDCPLVRGVIVVERVEVETNMTEGRDTWWDVEMSALADEINIPPCPCEDMDSEDPLFILYTSGSTGKPKGVLHTTGGYLLYSAVTFKYVFDYKPEDIYFCTADIGWVTGHSYVVYGPLSQGATCVIFEGVPTYPEPDRFWQMVERHKITILYTAPTAIRALIMHGDEWVTKHDLSTLRLLGSVGEPINPEAWMWYYDIVGGSKLPIVDTWWQTETGGIMITPLPGAMAAKPGSAMKPFFGIVAKVLREDGSEADRNEGGYLAIEKPWPGMLRGTYGDKENKKIKEVYFTRFPGYYTAGDSARVDEDGDFWIMGRIDDVLNVAGHRLGTAEVESSLVSHRAVSEAAVVGYPHEVKGEGIYAYVSLKEGVSPNAELTAELKAHVTKDISPIARPDKIQFTTSLPKTRSGKIMRRVLRKIASGKIDELGDTSTLADPSVVDKLVKERI